MRFTPDFLVGRATIAAQPGPCKPERQGVLNRSAVSRHGFCLLLLAGACGHVSGEAAVPEVASASGATLMLDAGVWLQVRRDGRHSLGYGALPIHVPVARDAFDATALLDTVARRARPAAPASETRHECRYTATLHGEGTDDGLVHALPADLCTMLADAFRAAWAARSREAHSSDVIEKAWTEAPFQHRPR